jgi:WD40 repeat protein
MGTVERPEITAGFADFDAGHRDLVTVTRFNFYGNRIVTASSDHRMKVWDLKDGQWQLIDTWRAHDAEIRDVRFQTTERQPEGRQFSSFANQPFRQHGMGHSQANISAVSEKT